ncbi:excinuclease ABC subunit UvrA [Azohydromonas lata]|uniref:excinuclease ABC subunit UvrA n=1 Tax=Azohydromonas lata TaxID=45677 RepID=UPI000832FA99|nr:excinuclease ABC subunit UvrA [Azohydromonas lata]
MSSGVIRIRGARQHNLKNLDLDIRTGEMTVVTGPSGSGKSSLVFDTLYAEGQRRYVETFSAYARQFLDRMDRPAVDRVEGVPPAIAIDQTNPVRTSRSTVGTMTELNDHLKLLFARAADLFDRQTALPVRHDTPESIYAEMQRRAALNGDPRLALTFPVELPANTSAEEVEQWLAAGGFTKVQAERTVGERKLLDVVADRFRIGNVEQVRAMEAIELALKRGTGRLTVYVLQDGGEELWKFSTGLHCPESDVRYAQPQPSLFSFNSPFGACETCKGFGRVIGVDMGLVIPDERKTLRGGAIKPMQTPAWKECQDDLIKYAGEAGIPRDTAWSQLSPSQKDWVLGGSPNWNGQWNKQWYGVRRFFDYLESKAYKMHIRVLLSKYRSYTECPSCRGARLKTEALLWRIGTKAQADAVLPPEKRFMPKGVDWTREQLQALPGLHLHDLMQLSLQRLRGFFDGIEAGVQDKPQAEQAAMELLLDEVRTRLRYLCDVGLGYLTLDRQSRSLSGGEVQRINLTTALGTSLVNTLFVLDEPSIGLHPRDMDRIVQAMQRLRDAGNTLVVVEHDPAVMLAADRLIDMGPGPGERGGSIVFDGTPDAARQADTLTGAYLGARKHVGGSIKRFVSDSTPRLILEGAREHNLKNVTVDFPLQRLVVVTGVSGSGKSTLMQDVLYPALARHFGKATEAPGEHDRLLGADMLSDAVFVDQSPIGKTARSNPASYVGAFDEIRKLFAEAPLARERGYGAGMFSFNAGDGRCPTCGGSGFEHVEMQFLSDVYLRCPDCEGRRYRAEILDVKIERRLPAEVTGGELSVADVLELTVSEALQRFRGDREVARALQPIVDVGLDYLRLGQPVPTLSGGEAQRLKLAGFLAEAAQSASKSRQPLARKGTLFLFDEPTTGLHFEDIARLMRALRKLLEAGHSLIVIEHNLDVIRAADWLIDLGPEGGEGGGELVAACTPEDIKAHPISHTGRALCAYERALGLDGAVEEGRPLQSLVASRRATPPAESIRIVNAHEHNLKGVDVEIPHGRFSVITGVSGSGKSTLAFDILFNEGQRRYLESLNAYARSIVQPAGRPEVDAVYGIPPTVAIEQRLSRGGRKSTVATTTEVWHFLRLLWVKLGLQRCIHDGTPVMPQSAESIAAQLLREHRGQHVGLLAPLVVNRKGLYTDLAKWALARGHTHLRVDGEFVPVQPFPRLDRFKEHTVELPVGDLLVTPENENRLRELLQSALEHGKGVMHLLHPLDKLRDAMACGKPTSGLCHVKVFSTKRACPTCGTSYPELDPRMFSYNSKHGWCGECVGTGLALTREQRKVYDDSVRDEDNRGREQAFPAEEAEAEGVTDRACPACHGARLNPVSLAVQFDQRPISEVAAWSVQQAREWMDGLKLVGRDAGIARDVVTEIASRLKFLEAVGLGYLTLDRAAPTLSGGEAQRIRLAAQLGSNLQGVCYVLDEPTIGLHPRDNGILLDALQELGSRGNTLVVVEHDEDTIRRADHIIDIGPGAGRRGGQVVAQGTAEELAAQPASITGRFLASPLKHPIEARRPVDDGVQWLRVRKANLHNLQSVDVGVPLRRLVAVTGVSGSGKSTLARDVLLSNVQALVAARGKGVSLTGCGAVEGWLHVDRVLEVDQTPIGKTPRSCPATYIGFWDAIRKLFSQTLEAKARGYGPGRFSFNTGEGRCPACEGQGLRTIEMSFLPDVKLPCDVCHGQRFNPETLAVTWRGKSIGDVLNMAVDEAVEFFASMPGIAHPLQLLKDVGLGYLTLGQPSPTLSGGEAQRIKLVTELSKVRDEVGRRGQKAPHTLYVLDEPTVGLHMSDVERLIHVLHRLVAGGHSVVVIEHDLDLIAEADWVLDLGPEGGSGGGKLVVAGPPEALVKAGSHTGKALAPVLSR